jgi:hypothetical protein
MPYCENCGSPVNPDSKFCRNCGTKQNGPVQSAAIQPQPAQVQPVAPTPVPVQQPIQQSPPPVQTTPQVQPTSFVQSAPAPVPPVQAQPAAFVQPPPPQPKPSSGQVIGAIVLKRPKSFGRWDTYTGVITNQQFIIAQMTNEMLKTAINESRDQAKADGKGFWGQWSEQLKASFGYTKRYYTMDPATIIAETPGNFAIDNNTIREFKLKLKHLQGNENYDEWEIEIHTTGSKYEFRMDENSQFVDILKKAYPDRVKLPFGYFSKSININI